MSIKVKPFIASNPIVAPLKDNEGFRFDDRELGLMDSYANEQFSIAGTPVDYYSIDVLGSKKDPLYGEPEERAFKGPYRYTAMFSYAETIPEVREEGLTQRVTPVIYIPRKMIEDAKAPIPSESDVIHAWKIPFYSQYSNATPTPPPDAGYYFSVTDVDTNGYLFDSPSFVGYKCQLRRRSEFTPERRIKRP